MKKIIESFRQVGIILAFFVEHDYYVCSTESDRSRKKRIQ